jgi:hypothetical protein
LQALSKSSTPNTKAKNTTNALATSATDGEIAGKVLQKTMKPNVFTNEATQSYFN